MSHILSGWKDAFFAYYRPNKKQFWYIVFSFTVIAISSIWAGTALWQLLPIFIAHIYMLMQMRANRYMHILGFINAFIFAVAYLAQGLYTAFAVTIVINAPLNLISFVQWNKQMTGKETKLRRLTKKQILLLSGGFVLIWILLYVIFSWFGSPYLLLDNTTTILANVAAILGIFRYIEYTMLGVFNNILYVLLYITVVMDQPDQLPYLVNNAFGAISALISFRSMMKIYFMQRDREKIEAAEAKQHETKKEDA